jgi:hypothetical protein
VTNHARPTTLRRAGQLLGLACAIWFVVGFASAQTACAHDPRFACDARAGSAPVAISDPSKSWAYYGHLSGAQTQVYEFTLVHSARITWSLLLDERDARNPARPAAVLSSPNGRVVSSLYLSRPQTFYEPFSGQTYLTTSSQTLSLPAGEYRIDVAMRGGRAPQRYTMAIGEQERFALWDLPYVLGAIHRIRAQQY